MKFEVAGGEHGTQNSSELINAPDVGFPFARLPLPPGPQPPPAAPPREPSWKQQTLLQRSCAVEQQTLGLSNTV